MVVERYVDPDVYERATQATVDLYRKIAALVAPRVTEHLTAAAGQVLTDAEWIELIDEIRDVYGDAYSDALLGGVLEFGVMPFDADLATDLAAQNKSLADVASILRDLLQGFVEDALRENLREIVEEALQTGLVAPTATEIIQERLLTGHPSSPLSPARAEAFARTMVNTAVNQGFHRSFKAAGVPAVTWITKRDDRVREAHVAADRDIVMTGTPFVVGGYEADYPGDPKLPIGLRINCRCMLGYVDGNEVRKTVSSTYRELYRKAQLYEIPGRSKMNKAELQIATIETLCLQGFARGQDCPRLLRDMNMATLYTYARAAEIPGRSKMNKRQLLAAVTGDVYRLDEPLRVVFADEQLHLQGQHNQKDHGNRGGAGLTPGQFYPAADYPAITSDDAIYEATALWASPSSVGPAFNRRGELPHAEMVRAADRAARGLPVRASREAIAAVGLLKGMPEYPRTEVPHYRALMSEFDPERGVHALTAATPDLELAMSAYGRRGSGALIRFEPGTPHQAAFGGSFAQWEESIISGQFEFTRLPSSGLTEDEEMLTYHLNSGRATPVWSARWVDYVDVPEREDLTVQLFHLQGQHDQKSHGRRGSGKALPTDMAEQVEMVEGFLAPFTNREGRKFYLSGYDSEDSPPDVYAFGFGPTIDAEGVIVDEDGDVVGDFTRRYDFENRTVRNMSLHVRPTGRGIGTAFLDSTEQAAAEAGFEEVSLHAISVGRYAWAARGYRLDTTESNWPATLIRDEWLTGAELHIAQQIPTWTDEQDVQFRALKQSWRDDLDNIYPADLLAIDDRFKRVLLEGPGWPARRRLDQTREDLAVEVFHLQGQHNQKDHGRRGSGRPVTDYAYRQGGGRQVTAADGSTLVMIEAMPGIIDKFGEQNVSTALNALADAYDFAPTPVPPKIRLVDNTAMALDGHLDRLRAQHPDRDLDKSDLSRLAGFVNTGEPTTINVNADAPFDETPKRRRMPVTERIGNLAYTVTHEYGHAHMYQTHGSGSTPIRNAQSKASEAIQALRRLPEPTYIEIGRSMTPYGRSKPSEAYAEAFVEYVGSRGETTNTAAVWFSEWFDWDDAEPLAAAAGPGFETDEEDGPVIIYETDDDDGPLIVPADDTATTEEFGWDPSQPRHPAGSEVGGQWRPYYDDSGAPIRYFEPDEPIQIIPTRDDPEGIRRDEHNRELREERERIRDYDRSRMVVEPATREQRERFQDLYGSGKDDNNVDALFTGPAPTTPIPFPSASRMKGEDLFDRAKVEDVLSQDVHLSNFDPRTLVATQPGVTRPGVEYYMGTDYQSYRRTYADQDQPGNKYPIIYRAPSNGELRILSGHHRATAALLQGKPLVGVYVDPRITVVRSSLEGWEPTVSSTQAAREMRRGPVSTRVVETDDDPSWLERIVDRFRS